MAHTLPQNGELSYPVRVMAGTITKLTRRDLFAGALGAHLAQGLIKKGRLKQSVSR
jgi:hypothetical protein